MKDEASLTINLKFVLHNNKKDQRTKDPFCFLMQCDVKNTSFARKFSLDNGKNLAGLKCLHK